MFTREQMELERLAKHLSKDQGKPWYVCDKTGKPSKLLSQENLKRYMQLGYKVNCAYWQGERYKNVYTFADGIQTVM